MKGRQVVKHHSGIEVIRRTGKTGVVFTCLAAFAFAILVFPHQTAAQTGNTALRGLVVDTTTMEPVVDAFVYLLGVRAAAHTDPTGEFVSRNAHAPDPQAWVRDAAIPVCHGPAWCG